MDSYYHLVLAGLLLAVHIILSTFFAQAQYTNFSFPSFSTTESFLLGGPVAIYPENSSFLMNAQPHVHVDIPRECGRLAYKDKVRMKDSASGGVASFNTSFTFQITGNSFTQGDGLAFTFARDSDAADDSCAGGPLCLFLPADNGNASNHVFAVEFDNYQNPEYNDPSDSHIGVDINSVNSTWTYNLCGGSVTNCSYLYNTGFFTAWIDYDSESQNLQVFFGNGSLYNNIPKPPKPLINTSLTALAPPLAEVIDEYMYIGFTSSSSMGSGEIHWIQSWMFTSSGIREVVAAPPASNSSLRRKVGITAGVLVGAVGASLVVFFIFRRASYMKQGNFGLVDENLVPCMFTYEELSMATKNFSRSEFLGRGVFGEVYKGTLPSGALVAVKQMRMEFTHVRESFEAGVASLHQIRHQHLVQLRGWCCEEEQLFLVYDYMCNGSLDEWLFQFSKRNGQESLTMNRFNEHSLMLRHRILSDVALGLSYLHDERGQCMLHQDIKSSNVLLDGHWNAYLGDFGLACIFDYQQMDISTRKAKTLAESFGYLAPEMPHTGKATKESDVYSFGVLMLEVMCGSRPLDTSTSERGEGVLVDRVWRAHEAGNILQMADSRLEAFPLASNARSSGSHGEIELLEVSLIDAPDAETVDKKLVTNLLHLGLLCCNPIPEDRLLMGLVSKLLLSTEYMEIDLPPLPASKPQTQFSGPAREIGNTGTMEKLESYLKHAEECMEAVQKMSNSRKFNNEQCEYVAEKLKVVVQSASWFLEVSRAEFHRPRSTLDSTRVAQNFKLLVALAKQTELFVQGSCKYEWIQAAITLSSMSEYVSSIGFNLELCRIAFSNEYLATECLSLVEVDDINKAEVKIVEEKASLDVDALLRKVTLELDSLEDENKDLANYLRQTLCRDGPNPTSDDEMDKLFNCVKSGEQLGRGASATVYKALWLGTPVAKKTFEGSENSDFLKEVQILAQLSHPNITSMFCYSKSKQNCSIIMELMDEDLFKLMERRGGEGNDSQPFLTLEAVDIMLQIGEGVNYLHGKRIVHRDLKSMNILVKKAKNAEIAYIHVKVTDFGLSKKKDNNTTYSNQTFNIGTSRWMPPEIIKLTTDSQQNWLVRPNNLPKYPFKCDSYSFGMVCYEILTGCVPFSSINNPKDIKRKVMGGKRPPLPTNCPSKLRVLIEKCWSQEPKERPTFAAICLEIKYLKYLLMTGNDTELASRESSNGQ